MPNDLSLQRRQMSYVVCGLTWLHVFINGTAAYMNGADVTAYMLASLAVAIITTATLKFSPSDSAVRLTTAWGC